MKESKYLSDVFLPEEICQQEIQKAKALDLKEPPYFPFDLQYGS